MSRAKKISLTLLFLILAGLLRLPLERPLAREMRSAGLLAEPLDQKTSEAIGQTSAVIALGGLRSLVAAVLNFSEVVPAWQNQDWLSIFSSFKQIHTLQPQAPYYWEAAAGFAADDAYADYKDRSGIPDSQRTLRRDEFFNKGVSYLDRGLQQLPDNLSLWKMKARLYSDIHKPDHLDYKKAAEVLDQAVQVGSVSGAVRRQRLYLMSRVPERHHEALVLARELYADPKMRFPSVKSSLFALQKEFPDESAVPDLELYRSKGDLVRSLFNHYRRRDEGLPMAGVRATLADYLATMELPYALDPLRNTDIRLVPFKMGRLYDFAPLTFPLDPFTNAGDWPLVVDHFQEFRAQSLPTIRVLFFVLQNLTEVEIEDRVKVDTMFPDQLFQLRDLTNYQLDPGHSYPRNGVAERIAFLCQELELPPHLSPHETPELFPLTREWMDAVTNWKIEQHNLLNR